MRVIAVLIFVFLISGCSTVSPPETIIFRGATVITMNDKNTALVADVIVRDGRISSVSTPGTLKRREIRRAEVVDCFGMFILPGLVDMHTHYLSWDTEYWPISPRDLFVAYGVTTVRICDAFIGDVDEIKSLGARPERGPNVIECANEHQSDPIAEVLSGRAAFLKVKDINDPAELEELMLRAEAVPVYTVGHLSGFRDLQHAFECGLDEIAHIRELSRVDKTDDWLHMLVASGVPVHTTLALFDGIFAHVTDAEQFLGSKESKYLPLEYRESIACGSSAEFNVLRDDWGGFDYQWELFQADLQLLRELHSAGVSLIAATDSGAAFYGTIPGLSMHQELSLLVDNGFTPEEAIACCTTAAREVARKMGIETIFGTLEPGNRADLLVVERDPRGDIAALSELVGVMVAGKWYNKEFINNVHRFAQN